MAAGRSAPEATSTTHLGDMRLFAHVISSAVFSEFAFFLSQLELKPGALPQIRIFLNPHGQKTIKLQRKCDRLFRKRSFAVWRAVAVA